MISATNIANRGLLQPDNQGLIRLEGQNVDLSRGGIKIKSVINFYDNLFSQIFCFFGGTTFRRLGGYFYIPDIGISDAYWGGKTNDWPVDSIYFPFGGGFVALTPPHDITGLRPPYFTVFDNQFFLLNPQTFGYTAASTPTNIIFQAVFVVNDDTNIFADVRFGPSTIVTNPFTAPVIEFSALEPDVVAGGFTTNKLYFMDQYVAETNHFLLTNLNSSASVLSPTAMPTNYAVSRTMPCEFFIGRRPNIDITPDVFYNATYSNRVVQGLEASAYSWRATNVSLTLPNSGGPITNASGRIEINADTLNMERTRIRGEGFVSIKANHLLSSSNAVVDVDHVGYTLGATNGNLVVQNLVNDVTRRMSGDVLSWSGTWSNFTGSLTVLPPVPPDTNAVIVTNVITLSFHAWIVWNRLQTRFPVTVHEFVTHSTNVTVGDRLNITDSLSVDAERLTVTGAMNILDTVHDWKAANFPRLSYLTNLGTINITNAGFFGSDRTQPYVSMVNRGSILGVTHLINADNFENSGSITALRRYVNNAGGVLNVGGPLIVQTRSGKLAGGIFVSGGDIRFEGSDLKFLNHTNEASGALFLDVTNSLADSGGGAGNDWRVSDGFNLLSKPVSGDLFGTTLRTTAPQFREAHHTWAGEDRGTNLAGFNNNVVIGHLILDAVNGSLLSFSGTGSNNALYVDFLDIRGVLTNDLPSAWSIDTNLVIYFADANVPVDTLDGQFADAQKPDGRLRWVKDFAGPNSSVDVLLANGQTVKMNRALRFSTTIDTDGDGVVNAYDAYPLDAGQWNGVTLSVQSGRQSPLRLSWMAAPGIVYQVETATNLAAPKWQTVTSYTNLSLAGSVVTISPADVNAGEVQRYYRVRYTPQ
ncbi:MAG: hypothetical protein DME22_20305 [Verrucomicrobia bacterium]|nr:MAG: hypothetical protein DME22_20305 [Verrucomicrobiota bacterium]